LMQHLPPAMSEVGALCKMCSPGAVDQERLSFRLFSVPAFRKVLKHPDPKELGAAVFAAVLTRQALVRRRPIARRCFRRSGAEQFQQDQEPAQDQAALARQNDLRPWAALAVTLTVALAVWPMAADADTTGSLDMSGIWQKALNSAAKGGVAGLVAGFLQVLSFMWLRTAMNYQYASGGSLSMALSTLWEEGGIRRLYQGVQLAVIQAPLSRLGDTAANAGVLVLMDFYFPEAPLPLKTAVASTAAASWRVFLTPVDTLKTTYQVRGESGLDVLLKRVKKNGPGELYAGAIANFAANWVGNYPYFVVFNALDQAWLAPSDQTMKIVRTGVMGMCSSISSDTVSNSFRVLKTIRQSSEESEGYLESAQRVIERDGLVGLLGRGLETRLLVNVLQGTFFTIIWKTVEAKLNEG